MAPVSSPPSLSISDNNSYSYAALSICNLLNPYNLSMSRVEPRDRPEGKFKVTTGKGCQDIIRNQIHQEFLLEGWYLVERKEKTQINYKVLFGWMEH